MLASGAGVRSSLACFQPPAVKATQQCPENCEVIHVGIKASRKPQTSGEAWQFSVRSASVEVFDLLTTCFIRAHVAAFAGWGGLPRRENRQ